MNRRQAISFLFILIVPLMYFNFCWGQFQYFGLELGLGSSVKGMASGQISFNYLRQFSSFHGLGVEVNLPKSFNADLTDQVVWDAGTPWEGTAFWTRTQLPSAGIRYRFFAGNHFFVGGNLQLGAIREKCFVDRAYLESYLGEEILPIYFDYRLTSPYARVSGEIGVHWSMGQWLFGSILLRGGPQFTISRVGVLGFIPSSDLDQQLDSYDGIDLYGNAAIGFGVKL